MGNKYYGNLSIIGMKGCEDFLSKVNSYLHEWRSEEKDVYNPDIQSVIIAHPPNIMAFAVTEKELDPSFLPEVYLTLRNIHKYPFGSSVSEMDKLARDITVKNPAAIIENDCVIATGATLLKAFDRLEMMEYSAKALVLAATYGEDIIGIDPMEFRELEAAFKL